MNRPGGTRDDGDFARGASTSAAKGALLVAVAIIIGLVLLQVTDNNKPASSTAGTTVKPTTTTVKKTTTTTKKPTTTTTTAHAVKSPDQVSLVVLNAGAPTGSAKTMADSLKSKGYINQPNQPTDWTGKQLTGNAVYCKAGYTQEAAALAVAVGAGTPTAAFPTPAPPSSANVICVVAVGSTG
jgi:hypothetical protein